ncbi:winged helix-turn-helix domain-containing protein [Nioella nitratireducens]|uniref:winged helix-turn-helix domain-containing protein n=1 Tax=Nioella nitratireducens TaxID=1287720 RepID=UPI0008FD527D|nr:winged helix-turn-helix domain-containing protein [Nioella nitratireducens]
MTDPIDSTFARLRIRVHFGEALMLGPGKADLLELIGTTGSISAAGRAMSMSYKRAWSLVDEMNHAFQTPLVESARGGPKGGGAHLTDTGQAVLDHYRKLEDITAEAGAARIGAIRDLLKDVSDGK